MERITGILCTVMISAISPLYIISNGLRASIPLLIALAVAIVMAVIGE